MSLWHNPSTLSEIEHYPSPPAKSNSSLCDEFFTHMEHTEKQLFSSQGGGENFYCISSSLPTSLSTYFRKANMNSIVLHYIFISPAHQGLGLGKWLLQHKLNEINKSGRKTLLVGTPAAIPLYRRLGFVDVGGFDIDLKSRGIEGDGHWAAMIREPRSEGGVE